MTLRNYDRFIPGEEIAAVEQWNFGAIDTAAQLLAAQTKARQDKEDAAQRAAAQQQSYQQGFEQGIQQGRKQAQAEVQAQMQAFLANQANEAAQQFSTLMANAERELVQAEQAMAQEVLSLACELARQIVRHELSVNPQVLMPVVSEALALLGADCKTVVVKLNPADLQRLGDQIHENFAGLALTLRADPAVQPGGCVLESAGTVVDATVPKRWQRAVASLGLDKTWEDGGEQH